MQRSGWTRNDLIEFLKEHGMTPQVASRRVTEVVNNELNVLSNGYKGLSEDTELYDEDTRKIYRQISDELLRMR